MGSASLPGFRTLSELEAAAQGRLPPALWDYVQGGAGDERTLAENLGAFRRRALRPRVLVPLRGLDPTTTLLHTRVRSPFFVAPTAYQGQIHPEGEPAVARAAADAGVLGVFSTLSTFPLEEIARASGAGPRWFQLYLQPTFDRTVDLVRRAERAGFTAIVLTADVPLLAVRDRQAREGFALDAPVPLGNGPEFVSPARAPAPDGDRYRLRPELSEGWAILDRLRAATHLPIVVKGILRADDARAAVDRGARGIVVSNHGGRQLDRAVSSLAALPEVLAEVGKEAEVYLDGGVRRGSDVAIALSLGARAVGLGRPILWALAVGGKAGVARYLELLREELVNVMALCGCESLAQFGPELLAP